VQQSTHSFGSGIQSVLSAFFLVLIMWLVYWAEHLFDFNFHQFGVLPHNLTGLRGIIFMPFIHAKEDVNHIINNSAPIFLLLASLFYFYRDIAYKVLTIGWLSTGALVWIIANGDGAYHIGMSGIIYCLAGFLFVSGVLRGFRPLQAISLAVVFMYGSMLWGIFPMKESISWEGHLSGLFMGVLLAFYFKEKGPQRPKFQYEIEREMGIEPPDLEGMWNERLRLAQEAEERKQREIQGFTIVYHYKPDAKEQTPPAMKPDRDLPHSNGPAENPSTHNDPFVK
jgi:membrane associated rhomboid family serine protease